MLNAELSRYREVLVETENPGAVGGVGKGLCLKPVLNWANVCSPEHTSDTSTNYDSFLN